MDVSVIIPTHNRSDALTETLRGLTQQDFAGAWETIVINNNCTDDTDEVVENFAFSTVLKLVREFAPGAAAARNAGAKVARGEFLIFVDNDILVQPDFVSRHFRALKENHDGVIIGRIDSLTEQSETLFGEYREHLYPPSSPEGEPSEATWATGQNFSLRRIDFEQAGGFDMQFKVASYEDYDLALTLRKRGKKVLYYPSIGGVHNDWAGWTIADYCHRQRLYSRSEIMFWRKIRNDYPRKRLLLKNLPPEVLADKLPHSLKKRVKAFLGSDLGQSAILTLGAAVEKILPKGRAPRLRQAILWKIYKFSLAGAIYRGFQEGLAETDLSAAEITELSRLQ